MALHQKQKIPQVEIVEPFFKPTSFSGKIPISPRNQLYPASSSTSLNTLSGESTPRLQILFFHTVFDHDIPCSFELTCPCSLTVFQVKHILSATFSVPIQFLHLYRNQFLLNDS